MSEGLFIVQIKLEATVIGRTEEKHAVDELMRSIVDRQQIEPIDEQIGEIRRQRLKFEMDRSIHLRNQRDEMVVEEGEIRHRRDILSRHRWNENRWIVRNEEDERIFASRFHFHRLAVRV